MDRRWIPILREDGTYCSPACGGRKVGTCTMAAHDAAWATANTVVATLDGEPFEARVWENLGWHWQVRAVLPGAPDRSWIGPASLIVTGRGDGFTAYVDADVNGPTGTGDTPKEAVAGLLERRKTLLQREAFLLELVERCVW
jgi:hypothetical protein